MKKKLIMIAMAGLMAAMANITAMAGQWLGDEASGWKYQYEDGNYAAGWNWIDGKSYYFDESGNMLRNTTTPDGYQVEQSGAWTVDGVVQTQGAGTTDYDPNYPLKGMLEQFGLNTTGTVNWDLLYGGGNGSGLELPSDGKYYLINRGIDGLGAYAAALAGEAYHSDIGDLDPIVMIADNEIITIEQASHTVAVIRDFLNSFDWRNASDLEKANKAAELVTQSQYVSGSLHEMHVFGNLIEKRGTCAGFASSFHVLTRLMGMDSLIIIVTTLEHAWNFVKIDDIWYNFDGSQIAAYGTSLEFDDYKIKDATKYMTTYYETTELSILGFNQ